MAYVPVTWSNETPGASPLRFTLKDADGVVLYDDVTIDLKTSVTAGTPLNSTNMNHIEQGIKDAQDTADAQVILSKLVDGILTADTAGRAKMADGFINLAKMAADLKFQKLYEFIADGSNQPDWTGIPGTFRHLIMIYSGMSSRVTAGWDGFSFHVNGDVSAAYSTVYQNFTSSNVAFVTGSNPHADGVLAGLLPAQNAGFLGPGSGITLFPDYAGSTFYKTCVNLGAFMSAYDAGLTLSTSERVNAEPITRLTGYMVGGEYPRAGSVFSLYGFN